MDETTKRELYEKLKEIEVRVCDSADGETFYRTDLGLAGALRSLHEVMQAVMEAIAPERCK